MQAVRDGYGYQDAIIKLKESRIRHENHICKVMNQLAPKEEEKNQREVMDGGKGGGRFFQLMSAAF